MSMDDFAPWMLLLIVTLVAVEVTVTPERLAFSQSRTWSGVCRPAGADSTWGALLLTAILNVSPAANVQPLVGEPDAAVPFDREARNFDGPFMATFVRTGTDFARLPYTKRPAVVKSALLTLVWSTAVPVLSLMTMVTIGVSPAA